MPGLKLDNRKLAETMSDTIEELTIIGFKSIRGLENFKMRDLNVLIGSSAAGKSNFVSFSRRMRAG